MSIEIRSKVKIHDSVAEAIRHLETTLRLCTDASSVQVTFEHIGDKTIVDYRAYKDGHLQ